MVGTLEVEIIDADIIEALQEIITEAPRLARRFVDIKLKGDLALDMLERFRSLTPPPQTFPLTWPSAKQRRFVMAKLRGDNNLPYQRTGQLQNGWRVNFLTESDTILMTLDNEAPHWRFVVGGIITADSVRQPMFPHWFDADEIVLQFSEMAQDRVITFWTSIVDAPKGTFR